MALTFKVALYDWPPYGAFEVGESMAEAQTIDKNVCCPLSDTARKIADTFQDMVMVRGYNAVSYGDLAKALGIRTASIHYHFPSKAELGAVVIRRYRENSKACG